MLEFVHFFGTNFQAKYCCAKNIKYQVCLEAAGSVEVPWLASLASQSRRKDRWKYLNQLERWGVAVMGAKTSRKVFYVEFLGMVTDGNVYRTTLEDLPSPHLSEWVLEVGSTGGASLIFPGQSSQFRSIIQCFFQITAFANIH